MSGSRLDELREQFLEARAMWASIERANVPLEQHDDVASYIEELSVEIARYPARNIRELCLKAHLLRSWLLEHLFTESDNDDPCAVGIRGLIDDIARLAAAESGS